VEKEGYKSDMLKDKLFVYDDFFYKSIPNNEQYDKLYAGAWCWRNWSVPSDAIITGDFWSNHETLKNDINFIKEVVMRLLPEVHKVLKKEFKVPISIEDFTKLYYAWMFNIIFKIYGNWKMFERNLPDITSYVFDIKYQEVVAENLKDSGSMYYYSKWNFYIISEIIREKKINNITIKYVEDEKKIKENNIKGNNIKNFLSAVYQRVQKWTLLRRFNTKKGWIFYYFTEPGNSYLNMLKNETATRLIQLIYSDYKKELKKVKINSIKRESLNLNFNPKNSFEGFISNIFFKIIPKSLFEGIEVIENYSPSIFLKNPPNYLVYSDFLNNELLLFYLRNFKKNKLFVYQHGGGFGYNDYTATEIVEKFYCHRYLTWGWKNDLLDVPWKKPDNLAELKVTSNKGRKDICFILYDSPPFLPTFQPTIFSTKYSKYLLFLNNFLQRTIYKNKITFRLYPRNDSGINLKDYFSAVINFDNSKTRALMFNKYLLFVYTYNSTGFIELWSLNIPCILLIEEENWFVNKLSRIHFLNLKDSCLLFSDIADFEAFLNKNLDSLNDWWNLADVQSAKNNFVDLYAKKTSSEFFPDDIIKIEEIFDC